MMAKSTIEALEKAFKKFLLPIEEKIGCVLSELIKLEAKICKIEKQQNTPCHSCSNISANDSRRKPAEHRSIGGKDSTTPSLTGTARTTGPVLKDGGRRSSMPQTGASRAPAAVAQIGYARAARALAAPPASQTPAVSPTTPPTTLDVVQHKDDLSYSAAPPPVSNHDSDNTDISDDQDRPWQEVRRKNYDRKRRVRTVITGTGSTDNELQSIERVFKIHACRFKPDTSETSIKSYMTKKSPGSEYTVQKLQLRHDYYSSFIIAVPLSKSDFFMSPENWPRAVEVSKWFRRSGRQPARAAPHSTDPEHAPGDDDDARTRASNAGGSGTHSAQ
ncbi:hypothetical protein O0L34_g1067 [Tuta absoluta]|nr:hypothetical protein O0L34_g1067 [Tuta absoluta]